MPFCTLHCFYQQLGTDQNLEICSILLKTCDVFSSDQGHICAFSSYDFAILLMYDAFLALIRISQLWNQPIFCFFTAIFGNFHVQIDHFCHFILEQTHVFFSLFQRFSCSQLLKLKVKALIRSFLDPFWTKNHFSCSFLNFCIDECLQFQVWVLTSHSHNYFVTSYARACFSAHMIFICRKCRISFTHWEGFLALIGFVLTGQLCLQVYRVLKAWQIP